MVAEENAVDELAREAVSKRQEKRVCFPGVPVQSEITCKPDAIDRIGLPCMFEKGARSLAVMKWTNIDGRIVNLDAR